LSITEIQIINLIINKKDISICTFNNITEDYFVQNKNCFKFIYDHYQQYKCVPDRITVLEYYPDFENIIVTESEEFLIKKIKEDYLFRKSAPFFNKTLEIFKENSNEAIKYFYANAGEYLTLCDINGVNYSKDSDKRFNIYKERVHNEKINVIPTPFKELTDYIYGWRRGEELVAILGRPKTFKSWFLYLIGLIAKNSGERVGIFSGESSEDRKSVV
jgi:replicative DNA helicase